MFDDALFANIQRSRYVLPRKIQSVTFPLILDNFDIVAMTQTGTGKTAVSFFCQLSKSLSIF